MSNMVKWFIKRPKGFAELNHFGSAGWRFTMRSRVPWSGHMVVADGISCVCSLDPIILALLHNAYNAPHLKKCNAWRDVDL